MAEFFTVTEPLLEYVFEVGSFFGRSFPHRRIQWRFSFFCEFERGILQEMALDEQTNHALPQTQIELKKQLQHGLPEDPALHITLFSHSNLHFLMALPTFSHHGFTKVTAGSNPRSFALFGEVEAPPKDGPEESGS